MEYGSVAWMCAADTYLVALDGVHRRASRAIGEGIVLDSLAHRRKVGALTYLFKLQCRDHLSRAQELVPPPKEVNAALPRYNTRQQVRQAALVLHQHPHQLQQVTKCTSLNMVQRTFPYAVVGVWNGLPAAIFNGGPQLDNLQEFKVAVHRHLREAES